MGQAVVGTFPARAGHKKRERLMLVRTFLALLLGTVATGALAQVNPALYEGPDRLERLIAGAKKDGELSLYTSAQADDIGAVAKAFEQKYGVKGNMWRAGAQKGAESAPAPGGRGEATGDAAGS